jgi:hypothetical protein
MHLGLLSQALLCSTASPGIRIGSWNLYYKALDDDKGRGAIVAGLEKSAAATPYDFFSLIEAAGNTPDSAFPAWTTNVGAFKGMKALSGVSGYETIALLYRADTWSVHWWHQGEMEEGRPFILAQFTRDSGPPIWVMNAHLPHYPQTSTIPGAMLAAAFQNATSATGTDPRSEAVAIVGDFNEFGECSIPTATARTKCTLTRYLPAVKGIKPLYDYFEAGSGKITDAVPFNTSTCCTKVCEHTCHRLLVFFSQPVIYLVYASPVIYLVYASRSPPFSETVGRRHR